MLEFFLDLTLYLLFKAILGAFFDIIFSGDRVTNVRFHCINHRADHGINLFVDILLRAADHRTDNVLNLGGYRMSASCRNAALRSTKTPRRRSQNTPSSF